MGTINANYYEDDRNSGFFGLWVWSLLSTFTKLHKTLKPDTSSDEKNAGEFTYAGVRSDITLLFSNAV